LGHRVGEMQAAMDEHAKALVDKDTAIRTLEKFLLDEKVRSADFSQQLVSLESIVGELRREQVESQGRIAELSASVKELEDAEMDVAAYWTAIGRIDLLREPQETYNLEKEIKAFKKMFPDQALP
jgi:chromosome segregation ATPase